MLSKKVKSIFKNIWFAVKVIGIAIILSICLRVFVFDSFKIPSPSMEPAIMAGDYILVNKLVLGGRTGGWKSRNEEVLIKSPGLFL